MIRIADEQAHTVRAALSYARRLAHNEACTRGSGDDLYEIKATVAEKQLDAAIAVVDVAILAREADPETSSQLAILHDIIASCQARIDRLLGAGARVTPDVAVLAERRDRAQRAVDEMRRGK